MESVTVINVNGKDYRIEGDPGRSLLQALREDIDLTGAKYGCGEGQCGSCTVLMDGKAVRSCITPVSRAAGKKIVTIEGLEKDGKLHPVQKAFLEIGAMQCGYCTPGMILSAIALLNENADPREDEVIRRMNGNVCRCGTYTRIVPAILKAAKEMREGGQ